MSAFAVPGEAAAQVKATVFADGTTSPTAFVQDPVITDVWYVVGQTGRIQPVRNGVVLAPDFLNLTFSIVFGGEQGLLGLVFAPDYAESGRFYVNFTRADDGHTVIARFKRSTWDPLQADPSTRFDLVWPDGNPYIFQPFPEHNGGHLAFGPDGFLYIGLGDGGFFNDPDHRAQNPGELLGKMLRIDVNVPDEDPKGYVIPPGNPFVGQKGYLEEIWAFGLRNPWRYNFDTVKLGGTGALVIGDVGQDLWEEIDYEPPGAGGRNYGWRNREGMHDTTIEPVLPPAYLPLTDPIFEYDHFVGRSITGGFVYRGQALNQKFVGRYFFADLFGSVYSLSLNVDPKTGETTAGTLEEHTAELGGSGELGLISSFGMDSNGELYIVSYTTGKVFRIDPLTSTNQVMVIDAPLGGTVTQPLDFVGWAIDLGAPVGSGVDVVLAYALPRNGDAPVFLGASGGLARPDVAAFYGAQFMNSGFIIPVSGLVPGEYELVAYAHSTVTDHYGLAKAVVVTIGKTANSQKAKGRRQK